MKRVGRGRKEEKGKREGEGGMERVRGRKEGRRERMRGEWKE